MTVYSRSSVRLSPVRRVGGRRRRPRIGSGAVRRRIAPTVWALFVLAILSMPIVVLRQVPRDVRGDDMRVISLVAALGGSSLLLAAYALPSRVRVLTSLLGMERLLDARLDLTVVEVLSRPPEGWDGEIGRIRESVLHSALGRRLNAHLDYFVCGPDPMVDLVTTILTERWEVPAKRVHTELFGVV